MYLINISKTDSIAAASVRRFYADSGAVVIVDGDGQQHSVHFGGCADLPDGAEFARQEYLRLREWMCGGYAGQPVFEFREMPAQAGPDSHAEVIQ